MLLEEIQRARSDLRPTADGTTAAAFVFPADFTGFQGHFPGRPVLPGVCLVQAVLALLGRSNSRPVLLREIVAAKFFSTVGPGDTVRVACRESPAGAAEQLVKAAVTCGDRKVAEISLRVAWARGEA